MSICQDNGCKGGHGVEMKLHPSHKWENSPRSGGRTYTAYRCTIHERGGSVWNGLPANCPDGTPYEVKRGAAPCVIKEVRG